MRLQTYLLTGSVSGSVVCYKYLFHIPGIKLRKVEKRCDENTGRYDTLRGAPVFLDVASILARRVAVELSDTSSGADSDSDDSDQWTESRA